MKVITKEEFDSFPIVDGYKQCPSGDYSKITLFQDRCTLGDNCKFGSFSIFIRKCLFGEKCIFGDACNFIQLCSFGNNCSFGVCCIFGKCCSFGECCVFDDSCNFGEGSSFGKCCIFNTCKIGQDSSFGKGCVFEGKCIIENEHITNDVYPLRSFSGFSTMNRPTYFFNCEDGILVRFGSFFGTIEQFREQVKENKTSTNTKE